MSKQFHYIYKITNKTNNKEYIGVHSSDKEFDEAYWSSSYYLNEDIKALGKHNFERIVLSYRPSREEALNEEARLVNADYVKNKNTYNIAYGGNSSERLDVVTVKDKEGNTFAVNKYDERLLNGELVGIMKGTPMSEEAKAKLSKAVEGKIWINKDEKNIRVWPNELEHYLSLGWIKGRTFHARKPHSEETRALIGKANSLCTRSKEYKENISEQFKNRIWISKEKESKFIDKSELNFYISNEWKIGRSPFKWKKNR
jgi:hypothetical protein